MELFQSSFIIPGAILCGLLSLFLYHVRRLRLYKIAKQFPGPPALPILGNALDFVGSTADILKKIMKLSKLYPSPFRVWLGGNLSFAVYDPTQIKTILNSPKALEKNQSYDFFRSFLGIGLLTAPASKWKVHRRLLNPTFSTAILETFIPVHARQSKILVQQLECKLDGEQFDMYKFMAKCTLDIICETAMGVSSNAQTDCDFRVLNAIARMCAITHRRAFQIWLHPDIIFNHTQLGRNQAADIECINDFTNGVIQKKKKLHFEAKHGQSNIAGSEDHQPRRKAFLDLLLEFSGDDAQFTDKDIRDEVITMIGAGHDTTAITNSFALLMLAMHQDVQERVYQELCEIYGFDNLDDPIVTKEDLPRMIYLERVIKETMRLFSAIPVIMRRLTEDLQMDEFTFPKDSWLGIVVCAVHRDEHYWPDPMKFDPDRFLPEECIKRHPYAFIPFSAGPRNCIGLKYAMMSMKTVLSTVVRRYIVKTDNIKPVKDIEFHQQVVLKPVEPIMLRIENRRTGANFK